MTHKTAKRKSPGVEQQADTLHAIEVFFTKCGAVMLESLNSLRTDKAEATKHVEETRRSIQRGATAPGKPFRL
jgi:hypothetical protein